MRELTIYEREAVSRRNSLIIKFHKLFPDLSYAELGRIHHLSKQRIAIILNGTGKKEAGK